MALKKEVIAAIVKEFGENEKDTGSTRVQVALLTQQIRDLTEHLKANKHDYHSQHGLHKMVGHRRSLLDYYSRVNREGYLELIEKLGLRK